MQVAEFLNENHVHYDRIPHRDTYDAQRMAATLHVSGHNVAKTVLLRADGGYTYIVAVLPADRAIDFQRASKMLGGSHLELATEIEMAHHCPDCEMGVLPPFGSQYGMRTMVDEHLVDEDEIVFEGNSHHEAIRMKFADFRRVEEPLIGRFTAGP